MLHIFPFSKMSFTPFILSVQVTQYLMDKTLIMDEDTLYDLSLKIEPRLPAWVTAVCGQWEPARHGSPLKGNTPT